MDGGRATMDFFSQQDRARSRTRLLIVLYALAVVLTCAAVAGVVVLLLLWQGAGVESGGRRGAAPQTLAMGGLAGALGAGLVIACGTAYRVFELRGGGEVVARQLGGRPLDHSFADADERRVLHVVEEMAIASGVPVPPVYLLDREAGINAFAAGYRPGDAVIGVTRGCVRGLSRDELQGVIAHEFSHILSGDMRLNIRLIGLLGGIVLISLMGYMVLRAAVFTPGGGRRNGRNVAAAFALGAALVVIGAIGSGAARLIQAAVSRQREYLADAAAVQFTRNPDGIGNALRRIGGASRRGKLQNAHAREMSHMCFANAVGGMDFLGAALASHPPVRKRVARILPGWDGSMLRPLRPKAKPREQSPPASPREAMERLRERLGAGDARVGVAGGAAAALAVLASAGTVSPQAVERAREIVRAIPQPLRDAAHDPFGCRAAVLCLLVHWEGDDAALRRQLEHLDTSGDSGVAHAVRSLARHAAELGPEQRLPLLDMCLATLSRLSGPQRERFGALAEKLAMADGRIAPFEWALLAVLERHLDEQGGQGDAGGPVASLGRCGKPLGVVLSTLAHAGAGGDAAAARQAFDAGQAAVPQVHAPFIEDPAFDPEAVDAALATLARLPMRPLRMVMGACVVVASHDGVHNAQEAELLRAVADLLGVPLPPAAADTASASPEPASVG